MPKSFPESCGIRSALRNELTPVCKDTLWRIKVLHVAASGRVKPSLTGEYADVAQG